MEKTSVIGIVGGGIAGLSCAYHLEQLGYTPILFESSHELGGRCKSENYEGYILDRGFQVLLTSYVELKKLIRFSNLDLGRFPAGVSVFNENKWNTFHNPLKHPLSIFELRNLPFASFADFVKLGSIYLKSALVTSDPQFRSIGQTTQQFLVEKEISPTFIEKFIRPFFGGVFLDLSLDTNPGIFQWMLRFFIEGIAVLPKQGIQAIPKMIAQQLKKTTIRLNQKASAIEGRSIFLAGGEEVKCEKIVLATDLVHAKELLSFLPEYKSQSVHTLYFSIDKEKVKKPLAPLLHINGSGEGPINHLAFVSLVQPSYAPKTKILAAVSIVDTKWQSDQHLEMACVDQLTRWFNISTSSWHLVKRYFIPHALPNQKEPPLLQGHYVTGRSPDIILCGEYVDNASLNGAAASGRKAAKMVQQSLQAT